MRTRFTLTVFVVLFIALCGAMLTPNGVASGDAPPQPVTSIEQQQQQPSRTAVQEPSRTDAEAPEPSAQPLFQDEAAAAGNPFPDVGIPGFPPTGNCCLFQIEKKADGNRKATYAAPYACPVGAGGGVAPTMRGQLSLMMILTSAGPTCDPLANLIPNGSRLTAQGMVIRRNDDFAYFSGQFLINNPAGQILFRGRIETNDRIGTHHLFFNCEACNPSSHFEGWLVGRGMGALANHSLRAMISARGMIPSPQVASRPALGSLSGTIIRCP
ncbi:MAG TPA: hypothetical protein VF666_16840 [Pyrinomonadaceae bacterium]